MNVGKFLLILATAKLGAMEKNNNNNNNKLVPELPTEIKEHIYKSQVVASSLTAQNLQDLTVCNDALKTGQWKDGDDRTNCIWQVTDEKGAINSWQLNDPTKTMGHAFAPSQITDANLIERTWKCDGPSACNTILMARNDLHKWHEGAMAMEEWLFDAHCHLYRLRARKKSCIDYDRGQISALALHNKTDRWATANGSFIKISTSSGTERCKLVDSENETDSITHLSFLTPNYLYAVHSGVVYGVDLNSWLKKGDKQLFKNAEGQEIVIQDFAIDAKNPRQGALLSSNCLYYVKIPQKKFTLLPVILRPLSTSGNRCLSMSNGKIGIYGANNLLTIIDIDVMAGLKMLKK